MIDRIETGVLVKSQKGENVSVQRKMRDRHQCKAEGQCSKGASGSFRHEGNQRGETAQVSSYAQKTRSIQKERSTAVQEYLKGAVHPERKVNNRARVTSKEIVRIRRVIIGNSVQAR